jgi:hypothetical protein
VLSIGGKEFQREGRSLFIKSKCFFSSMYTLIISTQKFRLFLPSYNPLKLKLKCYRLLLSSWLVDQIAQIWILLCCIELQSFSIVASLNYNSNCIKKVFRNSKIIYSTRKVNTILDCSILGFTMRLTTLMLDMYKHLRKKRFIFCKLRL